MKASIEIYRILNYKEEENVDHRLLRAFEHMAYSAKAGSKLFSLHGL